MKQQSYRARGVRTERYKYFKYFEQDPVIEELYDLIPRHEHDSTPNVYSNLVCRTGSPNA